MTASPPKTLTAFHCNACGRIAVSHPRVHYWMGKRCSGIVSEVTYVRETGGAL